MLIVTVYLLFYNKMHIILFVRINVATYEIVIIMFCYLGVPIEKENNSIKLYLVIYHAFKNEVIW